MEFGLCASHKLASACSDISSEALATLPWVLVGRAAVLLILSTIVMMALPVFLPDKNLLTKPINEGLSYYRLYYPHLFLIYDFLINSPISLYVRSHSSFTKLSSNI